MHCRCLEKQKQLIAIEDNKRDAIVKMKEAVKGDPDIAVKTVYTKYPQGGERTLIYALTGRMVNSSMLPADVNCVVNNIEHGICRSMMRWKTAGL